MRWSAAGDCGRRVENAVRRVVHVSALADSNPSRWSSWSSTMKRRVPTCCQSERASSRRQDARAFVVRRADGDEWDAPNERVRHHQAVDGPCFPERPSSGSRMGRELSRTRDRRRGWGDRVGCLAARWVGLPGAPLRRKRLAAQLTSMANGTWTTCAASRRACLKHTAQRPHLLRSHGGQEGFEPPAQMMHENLAT